VETVRYRFDACRRWRDERQQERIVGRSRPC
jgi:hypothetical protein